MSNAKDRRFLHTPPYAWEIGVVAAAGAIWKLLTKAEPDEDAAQADKPADPPVRAQA